MRVWIVLCRTGCDVTRWLCDACILLVRERRVEVAIQRELTTGFPCEECGRKADRVGSWSLDGAA